MALAYNNDEIKRQEVWMQFGNSLKDISATLARAAALCEEFNRLAPSFPPHQQVHAVNALQPALQTTALLAQGIGAAFTGEPAAAIVASSSKKTRARKEKKPKDPQAPKRPPSAYLLYQNHVRDQIRLANPSMPYKEVLGVIAEQWKALSAEEKKVYESAYIVATEDFRKRDSAYKANGTILPPAPGIPNYSAPKDSDSSSEEDSSSSEEEPAPVIPTPSKKDKKRKSDVTDKKKKKNKKD